MSRERRAHLGTTAGAALLVLGAAEAWGRGYGLIVAGVCALVWFLTFYQVDDPDAEE